MVTTKRASKRSSRRSLSLADQNQGQLSRYGARWLESRPKTAYEGDFWAIARFAQANHLRMKQAVDICKPNSDCRPQWLDTWEVHRQVWEALTPRGRSYEDTIRFCPICAECGWVPWLYSLPVLVTCPIHNARLTNACCNCGYVLKTSTVDCVSHPFRCRSCRQPWSGAPTAPDRAAGTEWPPDHAGSVQRLAAIADADATLKKLRLSTPESFNYPWKRPSSEFPQSVWGFVCGMNPEMRPLLLALSGKAAVAEATALGFIWERGPNWSRVNTATAEWRVDRYAMLRGAIGPHIRAAMLAECERTARSKRRSSDPSATDYSPSMQMLTAFMRWRGYFEGIDIASEAPFTYRRRMWDMTRFLESSVPNSDWLSYCLVVLFDELDKCHKQHFGWDPKLVRRECGLAQIWLEGSATIRLYANGRWPFLDEIVDAHGLALSSDVILEAVDKYEPSILSHIRTSGH